ncbi:MAG: rod shape-determining protein MreC [Candidatus Kerfeldbacteria bacterium]|nr:rod shape-determining protein MreC [Candidatus Kerfeldbacteria bacterium]
MKRWGTIGIIAAGFVLILGIHSVGGFQFIESLWMQGTQPSYVFGYQLGLRVRNALSWDEREQLMLENQKLSEERNALVIENARLKSSIETSDDLKLQLQFLQERHLQSVPARVFSRERSGSLTTVLLDKGSKDGIQSGQAVIADQGFLVGTIGAVEETFSHLILVTSSNSKIAIKLQNDSASPGVLEGERDLSVNINLIPQGERVEQNATVITSGTTQHIPEGLVVGRVDRVSTGESALFQSASVRLLLDLSRLTVVSVITL